MEDRFEESIEIVCLEQDNRLIIEFYGQLVYADIDIDGQLNIPPQVFQADFEKDNLDGFLGEDYFVDIQISGDGSINSNYGNLSVDFSFVISEEMDWVDMTSCLILLSR